MNLKGKIIKHINHMDVCFKVHIVKELEEDFVLFFDCINMAYKESFVIFPFWDQSRSMTNITRIRVSKKELDKFKSEWLECKEPEQKCLRDSKWEPITL